MAKQPRDLVGRVAAVTGGARGIGRATARALAREGVRVAIGDLDLALAERTARDLGGGVAAFPLDVTDRASFAAFLEGTERELGPLDVLVNNAGIMSVGPFLEEDDATARRQIDINVHGVLHGMKLALPGMVDRRSGHVVNIASSAGKGGFPGGATYSGTKHFVVGCSEAVRLELRGTGVELSCVMPGVVNTELAAGLQEARGFRNSDPEDVAEAIVDALKVPRFDVFVPRSIGPTTAVLGLLPRRAREAFFRAIRADRVLLHADAEARRAYERRAAASEPALDAADTARQLSARGPV